MNPSLNRPKALNYILTTTNVDEGGKYEPESQSPEGSQLHSDWILLYTTEYTLRGCLNRPKALNYILTC